MGANDENVFCVIIVIPCPRRFDPVCEYYTAAQVTLQFFLSRFCHRPFYTVFTRPVSTRGVCTRVRRRYRRRGVAKTASRAICARFMCRISNVSFFSIV